MSEPVIVPVGDQALKVIFENKISQEINRKVNALDKRLLEKKALGITETIPAFRTLTVLFDGLKTDYETLSKEVRSLCSNLSQTQPKQKRIIDIPVCYDEQFGIDLKDVAEHAGLSIEEVIQLHSGRDYLIYMLGFLPGFPYLGGMDPSLSMARLDAPRRKIKAGAVGIAGNQTGMYPLDSPGGWRIIGSTPVKLFDADRQSPFLYEAGDYIRFRPISLIEFEEIRQLSFRHDFQCTVVIEEEGNGTKDNE